MDDIVKDLWFKDYTAIIIDWEVSHLKRIKSMIELEFTMIRGLTKIPDLKRDHRRNLQNTKVYCTEVTFLSGRLVVVYNQAMESLKKDHYYEHSSNEDIAKYLGYSLIFHNWDLGIDNVLRKYYDKDSVERAFKQMKGVLDLRPVRVLLKPYIEGHVKICYPAYSILSYLSYILETKGI